VEEKLEPAIDADETETAILVIKSDTALHLSWSPFDLQHGAAMRTAE
jgi:hypothetical protein